MDGRCSLRLTRRYAASPAEVWEALTLPESLAGWLGNAQLQLVAGGDLDLELLDGTRVTGQVRTIDPRRLLELDWAAHGEEPSVVRFELAADGAGTLLRLEHRLLEERLGMRYLARWERAIRRLTEERGR